LQHGNTGAKTKLPADPVILLFFVAKRYADLMP